MKDKEFCLKGEHVYVERDVVRSVITSDESLWLVVCCEKCDSKFLRGVERLL